jgi:hypothetical protein
MFSFESIHIFVRSPYIESISHRNAPHTYIVCGTCARSPYIAVFSRERSFTSVYVPSGNYYPIWWYINIITCTSTYNNISYETNSSTTKNNCQTMPTITWIQAYKLLARSSLATTHVIVKQNI